MTLTEFLLGRIAEDEANPPQSGWTDADGNCGYCGGWLEQRMLAECEAKRRIIALDICLACHVEEQPCDHRAATLKLLALPYADHPDYDESWRL